MAMQSQASKMFSRNAKQLLGLLVLFSFSSSGLCQIVDIACPTTFQDDSITRVDCTIYSKTFSQSFCFSSASIEFVFSNSSVNTRLCRIPYYGPLFSDVVGDMNCAMVSSRSDQQTFQLNFRGHRASHEGGQLTCSISCTQPPSSTSSDLCGPLKFSDDTFSEEKSSCNDGCKAGIVIAIALVFIISGVAAKKKRWVQVTAFVEVS